MQLCVLCCHKAKPSIIFVIYLTFQYTLDLILGTLAQPFIAKLWHFQCNILFMQGDDTLPPVLWPGRYCSRLLLSPLLLSVLLDVVKRLATCLALKTLVRSSLTMASQSPFQLSSDPTCCHSVRGRGNNYGGGRNKCGLAQGVRWPWYLHHLSCACHVQTEHIGEIYRFICVLCSNHLYGNETCNYSK